MNLEYPETQEECEQIAYAIFRNLQAGLKQVHGIECDPVAYCSPLLNAMAWYIARQAGIETDGYVPQMVKIENLKVMH